MRKSEEISNPGSCLNKSADDEPLFVLRANDELAPVIVEKWALQYRESKGGIDKMTKDQRRKYVEAIANADRMRVWKGANP